MLGLTFQSGFVYLDSISRDDIFVRMPRADLSALKPPMSRVMGPLEVLTRSFHPFHSRICIYFNVPGTRLADHCRTQFPRDFYRSHRKKSFPIFPSPCGMSLTKLSLGGNNDVIDKSFPPIGRVW
jgi:hypothetical protein